MKLDNVLIQTLRAFRRPHLGCLEAWRAEWLASFEKSRENRNFRPPGLSKIELWRGLAGIFESFAVSGVVLVRPGMRLGRFGGVVGPS